MDFLKMTTGIGVISRTTWGFHVASLFFFSLSLFWETTHFIRNCMCVLLCVNAQSLQDCCYWGGNQFEVFLFSFLTRQQPICFASVTVIMELLEGYSELNTTSTITCTNITAQGYTCFFMYSHTCVTHFAGLSAKYILVKHPHQTSFDKRSMSKVHPSLAAH